MLLSSGTAVGQAIVVLSTPLWTRLYPPGQLGLFAVFMACASFAGAAVTLCYELAIPNAAEDSEAAPVLLLAMAVSLPCSVILSASALVLIRADLLSLGQLPAWAAIALLPVLFANGIFSSLRYWFVRRKGFETISAALVAQGSVRGLLPVLLGMWHLNWAGLMLGELAARLVGVWRMFKCALPHLKECLRNHGWQKAIQAARTYRAFPTLLLPSTLLGTLAFTLPIPLVAHYYGASAAGIFFIAQRVTTLPASFIISSVADVLHARIADALRRAPDEIRPVVLKAMRRLALLGFLVFTPTAALAPILCKRLFGGEYEQVGMLVAILSPWCFAELVTSPVSRLILVLNRSEVLVFYNVVSLAAVVVGLSLGHSIGLNFMQAIGVVVVLKTLAYVMYGAILLKIAHAHVRGKSGAVPPALSAIDN